jgi:hypothetical protein
MNIIDRRDTYAEIAYSMAYLWNILSLPLRQPLEQAIRGYVLRQPPMRAALERAADAIQPDPTDRSPAQHHLSCAALLYVIWERGDASLRSDIQTVIRTYVQAHPESLASFQELVRLHTKQLHIGKKR